MMKRLVACLLALLLCCNLAMAEPRYPERRTEVCDNACVLSASTHADLTALNHKLKGLRIWVAAVDFLDGESLNDYGQGLRKEWQLDDEDLLLLMAVGEDQYGFFAGEDWFDQSVLNKLLSVHFARPFLAQDYDAAVAALMPALAEEIGKVYGQRLDLDGMFGVTTSSAAWTREWEERFREEAWQGEQEDSIGVGKVILTVVLLLVIFGNHKNKRYYHGRRGCFPFSSLLAAFGLWKLWKKR